MERSPVILGNLAFRNAAWMTCAVSWFTGRKRRKYQTEISPVCEGGSMLGVKA